MKTSKCIMNTDMKNKDNTPNFYQNIFHIDNGVHELVLNDFIYKNHKLYVKHKLFGNKGFIMFYAPWCSHCKEFKKEYENIALDYIQNIPFGAVNVENVADGNDQLRIYAKVEGVPTLFTIHPDGYLQEYKSDINYDNLLYQVNMIL